MSMFRAVTILLLSLALGWSAGMAPTNTLPPVFLVWDPSPDGTVTNYVIYWGAASRNYTNKISTGNVTLFGMTNLAPGVHYYFAATAQNAIGLESDFSNEADYTTTNRPGAPHIENIIYLGKTNQVAVITGQGDPNSLYAIEQSPDLRKWSLLSVSQSDRWGFFDAEDVQAFCNPIQYYRAK